LPLLMGEFHSPKHLSLQRWIDSPVGFSYENEQHPRPRTQNEALIIMSKLYNNYDTQGMFPALHRTVVYPTMIEDLAEVLSTQTVEVEYHIERGVSVPDE
jgi:hypothetical protein